MRRVLGEKGEEAGKGGEEKDMTPVRYHAIGP